ncbi:hypothetical protein H4219_003972 [Mycoemilia scoparia]|uniref:Uncharacterized protein n=1 Tax=Mycoemilia scoparia TaxID=417184 RepID=A0A9W7ZT67_9FUNG|nr:hypothetical protein H4219_003972 [Mycoemilia scoparia]
MVLGKFISTTSQNSSRYYPQPNKFPDSSDYLNFKPPTIITIAKNTHPSTYSFGDLDAEVYALMSTFKSRIKEIANSCSFKNPETAAATVTVDPDYIWSIYELYRKIKHELQKKDPKSSVFYYLKPLVTIDELKLLVRCYFTFYDQQQKIKRTKYNINPGQAINQTSKAAIDESVTALFKMSKVLQMCLHIKPKIASQQVENAETPPRLLSIEVISLMEAQIDSWLPYSAQLGYTRVQYILGKWIELETKYRGSVYIRGSELKTLVKAAFRCKRYDLVAGLYDHAVEAKRARVIYPRYFLNICNVVLDTLSINRPDLVTAGKANSIIREARQVLPRFRITTIATATGSVAATSTIVKPNSRKIDNVSIFIDTCELLLNFHSRNGNVNQTIATFDVMRNWILRLRRKPCEKLYIPIFQAHTQMFTKRPRESYELVASGKLGWGRRKAFASICTSFFRKMINEDEIEVSGLVLYEYIRALAAMAQLDQVTKMYGYAKKVLSSSDDPNSQNHVYLRNIMIELDRVYMNWSWYGTYNFRFLKKKYMEIKKEFGRLTDNKHDYIYNNDHNTATSFENTDSMLQEPYNEESLPLSISNYCKSLGDFLEQGDIRLLELRWLSFAVNDIFQNSEQLSQHIHKPKFQQYKSAKLLIGLEDPFQLLSITEARLNMLPNTALINLYLITRRKLYFSIKNNDHDDDGSGCGGHDSHLSKFKISSSFLKQQWKFVRYLITTLQSPSLFPDVYTFSILIDGCWQIGQWGLGHTIWNTITEMCIGQAPKDSNLNSSNSAYSGGNDEDEEEDDDIVYDFNNCYMNNNRGAGSGQTSISPTLDSVYFDIKPIMIRKNILRNGLFHAYLRFIMAEYRSDTSSTILSKYDPDSPSSSSSTSTISNSDISANNQNIGDQKRSIYSTIKTMTTLRGKGEQYSEEQIEKKANILVFRISKMMELVVKNEIKTSSFLITTIIGRLMDIENNVNAVELANALKLWQLEREKMGYSAKGSLARYLDKHQSQDSLLGL